jgi:predicted phage-related endonuclease
VADLDVVWIPVLLARRDHLVREMYRVNRDEELIEMIRTRGVDFWQNHVLPKVKPEGEVPALEVLKRIKRIPKAVATVDEGVCLNYFAASEALRAAEKIADEAKAQVLLAMGEAEAGDWGDATTMLTFYEATREGVDTKRLKAEAPDTWLAYAKPTTYRTLRRAKK